MKLTVSKSKNSVHFYASKSVIINGKSTTKTVEKIGSLEEVKAKCGDMDPYEWARQYVKDLANQINRDFPGARDRMFTAIVNGVADYQLPDY